LARRKIVHLYSLRGSIRLRVWLQFLFGPFKSILPLRASNLYPSNTMYQLTTQEYPNTSNGLSIGSAGVRELKPPQVQVWESGGGASSGAQGQSPWSGVIWSWNTSGFWTFTKNRKFAHFFKKI